MSSHERPTGKRTALWIATTGLGQVLRLIISIASTIVLAHLLAPGDFGLMATAGPIMGFVDLLRDAGFSQALVQRSDVTREQGHGLFWLMMGLTLVLGLAVVALSPTLSRAFHEPRLPGVLVVAALLMQVSSFGSQPMAWLNRHMRFSALAGIDATSSACGLAAAVVVALTLHSYWALVAAGVAGTFTSAGLALWISGWRPGRPRFDRGVLQMARFGADISLFNMMNFMARNADNLLIARRFGPVQLGFYDRAYKLMLTPLTQITWPVSRVLVPVLSRLQDDPRRYTEIYLTTITTIMAVAQPFLLAGTVFGKLSILCLLGQRWTPAIPIFQWLSAAAVHQVVTSSHGWLYISQGRTRHYAINGAFASATTVAAFVVGLRWGPVGVAAAYTLSDYLVRLPFAWLYVGRQGPVVTRQLFAALWPHLFSATVAVVALLAFQRFARPGNLLGLGGAAVTAYTAYLPALMVSRSKRDLVRRGARKLMARLVFVRGPAALAP